MRFGFILLFWGLLACGGPSGLPSPGSADSWPVDSSQPDTPPAAPPAIAIETTTGGYITVSKIEEFETTTDLDFLAVSEVPQGSPLATGLYFLFRRDLGASSYMWDLYRVDANGATTRLCTAPQPISTSDVFAGMAFDGSQLRVMVKRGYYPVSYRVYFLDGVGCQMTGSKDAWSDNAWDTSGPLFQYVNEKFYFSSAQGGVRLWTETTSTVEPWSYQAPTIAAVRPSLRPESFRIGADGQTWLIDSNGRFWRGHFNDGSWDGFAVLPSAYYTLSSASALLVQSNAVRAITFSRWSGALSIYTIEASHF